MPGWVVSLFVGFAHGMIMALKLLLVGRAYVSPFYWAVVVGSHP